MVDPLETVVQYLKRDATLAELVTYRIASKHRYGESWALDRPSVTVRLDGGVPDLYVPLQELRLEVRCYGPSQYEAMQVWSRLVEIGRDTHRVAVATSEGDALLHYLHEDSGPSLLWDNELKMDLVLLFLRVLVAEDAVV